ncbi:esterase-like activity of phytase family protein [Actinoplanes bogorensis]|uniref:Esterase-like activity of phytase family protein n=1 Tax=Paractinoplanes bogorensis TaxID=1610840 RepID=A0ABS5YVV0_9ACTN|nr:esterase-like activity of phytase family protein [Actinoplanes bogorensis]MBU2666844.1 esterase-like activity of phytase family protein [Actinoplanes bogorensis]
MNRLAVLSLLVSAAVVPVGAAAQAAPASNSAGATRGAAGNCAPGVSAVSFSDALDKVVRDGVTVGGLSSLAWDKRTRSWASTVDNRGTEPARIWFFRDPANPKLIGDPLILRKPDGSPYDGVTADDEGLVVLANGDFVVSSEVEPAIRIFGRDGVEKASLPVPARFVAEKTVNATLEGLTIMPDGNRIIAAMEGALSGDTDAALHRFLVYERRHNQWKLSKQIAYRTEPGLRVPEVTAYGKNSLLVMEASFTAGVGNTVKLYAVPTIKHAPDVSQVADLATLPPRAVPAKKLVVDLVNCPTLGATAKQPQPNPLLDNYEAMALDGNRLHILSDDNFGATQITRLLTLKVKLPS